ncbi:MAG: hypothetical protein JWP87_4666 [Labilithrix sp.]|nr:hypothetical protein [Labilithrix sp.]
MLAGVCSVVVGCSLLTDLGGLEGPASTNPDARAGDDGALADGSALDGAGDGPVSIGPYVPRFRRTLTVANVGTSPAPSGHGTCWRGTPQDIFGAGFASKVRPDFADVRVFASGVEVKRTVDALRTGAMILCFRLARPIAAGAADDAYEVRYGDANALLPPPAEGDIFDFFDGFDGTALAPGWRKLGDPVVSGGTVTFPKNMETGITTVADTDGVALDAALEIKARVSNPASDPKAFDGGDTFYYWFGFQHSGDFTASTPWSLFVARSKSTINAEHASTGATTCVSWCAQAPQSQTTDFRVYTIERTGSAARFVLDDGAVFSADSPVGDLSILIRNYALDSDLAVEWVRARPLLKPEPGVAIGNEETVP